MDDRTSYDAVPYESFPYPYTQPAAAAGAQRPAGELMVMAKRVPSGTLAWAGRRDRSRPHNRSLRPSRQGFAGVCRLPAPVRGGYDR
jgi:hypothetical protein